MVTFDNKDKEKARWNILLRALRKVDPCGKTEGVVPAYQRHGICVQTNERIRFDIDYGYRKSLGLDSFRVACMLSGLAKSWPEFSGDVDYPVPSFTEKLDARDEYSKYFNIIDGMWGDNNYGDARRRLLKHFIAECEKKVEWVGAL